MSPVNDQRIIFLDYLRAIACLLVVLGHVYFMGFNGYEAITPYVPSVTENIFGPDAAQRNVLTGPSLFLAIKLGINVGWLGVSIFFLISGFVILKALDKEVVGDFLLRRVFRIYPVSIAAVFLVGLVTAWYCNLTGTVSPHSLGSLISSAFVSNGFLHRFEAVPVLWSLEVEIFFYIFMAILASARLLGFHGLLGLGFMNLVFTLAANTQWAKAWLSPSWHTIFVHMSFVTLQTTFLLVGSVIYRLTTAGVNVRTLLYLLASIGIFVAARLGYLALHKTDSGGVDLANGAWALAIFCLALWSGMHWTWIRPLAWFGDISYPLYLVHLPLAWISLAWMGRNGWGMLTSGIVSGVVVIAVAWVIHRTVETPSRLWGKSVINKLRRYPTLKN